MVIANAKVMNEDFSLVVSDVRIDDGKIAEIGCGLTDPCTIDAKGKYLLPGFIDTHIHGAYGVRVSDVDSPLDVMTKFEASQGVTGIAVTTASSEFNDLLRQLRASSAAMKTNKGAQIFGIHAEGPFICTKYKGAMTEKYILKPNATVLDEMMKASDGSIKIITIAPEVENAIELIKYASSLGIVVSMGHTDSDYETAVKAIEAGATRMTHTFNAARPIKHRNPGVLTAALTSDFVTCEMICDYVHLHPATVQLIYKLKGPKLINMISDSGHAAGLDVKQFEVDGVMRYVNNGVVTLENGTIAGSAMTLYDGFKNLIKSGIPIEQVSRMLSHSPAEALGISDTTGSICVGKSADIVLIDCDLKIDKTFVKGVCVFGN